MPLESVGTFVLQVNLVNAFDYLDKKGKVFSYLYKEIPDSTNRTLTNDEIRIRNSNIEYVVNTNIFALRVINPSINGILSTINQYQELFKKNVKDISKILGLEEISRFAYRLIASYSVENKEMKEILERN